MIRSTISEIERTLRPLRRFTIRPRGAPMVPEGIHSTRNAEVEASVRLVVAGVDLELRTSVVWDGKERRKGGSAEELRSRIDKLKQDWEGQRGSAKKPSKRSKTRRLLQKRGT